MFIFYSNFYHTERDVLQIVDERSMQHEGVNLLKLSKAIVSNDKLKTANIVKEEKKPMIFYDVLGS